MKIINTLNKIEEIFVNGSFNIDKWEAYIDSFLPNYKNIFIDDMNKVIDTGEYTFEDDYLPILNNVYNNIHLKELVNNFNEVTNNLESLIFDRFGHKLDCNIILYVGLCNGAGWVEKLKDTVYVLLGVEKILELSLFDKNSLFGLIYHELGHVYQSQYGILDRKYEDNKSNFLWQLFSEGIAMYFEQSLVGDFNYFHQDKDNWLKWCDDNFDLIKKTFDEDLDTMEFANQRYFGDWVNFNGRGDVGYYLGARFIKFIMEDHRFDDIIKYDINEVEKLYKEFIRK